MQKTKNSFAFSAFLLYKMEGWNVSLGLPRKEISPGSIPSVFGESRGARMVTFRTVTWLLIQKNNLNTHPSDLQESSKSLHSYV